MRDLQRNTGEHNTPELKLASLLRATAALWLTVLSLTAGAQETPPQPPTGDEMPLTHEARNAAIDALAPRYLQWLQSVRGLISPSELDYFLRLQEDFRRDKFIKVFWDPRDPDPETRVNELRARWEEHKNSAGGVPYDDPRFLLLLYNGPPGGWSLPDGRPVAVCLSRSHELEIWFYGESERTSQDFPIIFQRRGSETPYEIHLPGQGLRPMLRSGGLPSVNIQALCAEEVLRYTQREILRISNYEQLLREVMSPLMPSPEWLANLAASATDLPRGAETFEAQVDLGFPHRKQNRTAVQVMLGVALEDAPGRRFDDELFHNFQLTGEVIRDGALFESFHYRFEGPTPVGATVIPVGFTRYLRAGTVSLRLLLEDVYGGRFVQVIREIGIPAPENLPPLVQADPEGTASGGAGLTGGALGRPTIELFPPAGNVHVGQVRFHARAVGELEKVTFFLDDRPVLSKRRPPYSVELDLGSTPEPRRVRVVGLVDDQEVATDQIWLNQGAMRFRVHLIEPRSGGIYPGSLTARVQVDTPDGKPPQQLELFLNDEQVKSFAEPPYEQLLRLSGQVAVVRAVATLADGTSAEDAVVVNASAFSESVDVRLVEIPALVTDREGKPIRDLPATAFRVFDEDHQRQVRRLQLGADAPVQAAMLIDRSISMKPHLDQVTAAALAFTQATMASPDDRVAVLSFASELTVDSGLSARGSDVERALAGLDARGGTAFYDSLVQAFNTFDGLGGPLAMVLFTDGQDESSRLSYEQALEAARRASVTLYAIGLGEAFAEKQARRGLEELVAETGGRAVFLTDLADLTGIYLSILEELRTRYILTIQPALTAGEDFRLLRVEVDHKGARVRARRGYYP